MENPFLESLKPLWKSSRCIFVNDERIANVARKLAREKCETPGWNEPIFPKNFGDFMKFILIANAINFCFTDPWTKLKFAVNYDGTLWRGSMAMAACLKRALDEGKPLFNADYLENLTAEEVKNIFRTNCRVGEYPMPLFNERRLALVELGKNLKKDFGGSFSAIYEISGSRAFNAGRGLVELLIKHFPSFNDVSVFKGRTIQFQKRAQLLAMVYQGRAMTDLTRPFPILKDADALGPIADYAVPAALEDMGILVYSQGLKRKIVEREIIPKNSREEIEIRAQAACAMLKLMNEINKIRPTVGRGTINMIELDYMIWKIGRGVETPHHLTRTTAY